MAACIAWHFNEINSVLQFRTHRFTSSMAPAGEIIYDTLRELATLKAVDSSVGGTFLDDLVARTRNLQNHYYQPPATLHPHRAVVLVLLPFHRAAIEGPNTLSSGPRRRTRPAGRQTGIWSLLPRHGLLSEPLFVREYVAHDKKIFLRRSFGLFKSACSAGFAAINATCPGAQAAIPIASGWPKSCCSKHASPP